MGISSLDFEAKKANYEDSISKLLIEIEEEEEKEKELGKRNFKQSKLLKYRLHVVRTQLRNLDKRYTSRLKNYIAWEGMLDILKTNVETTKLEIEELTEEIRTIESKAAISIMNEEKIALIVKSIALGNRLTKLKIKLGRQEQAYNRHKVTKPTKIKDITIESASVNSTQNNILDATTIDLITNAGLTVPVQQDFFSTPVEDTSVVRKKPVI